MHTLTRAAAEAAVLRNLDALQALRGTTDAHLARAAGIHVKTLARRRRGEGSLTLAQAAGMAHALGVSLAELTDPDLHVEVQP